MQRNLILILSLFLWLGINSCSDNSTNNEDELSIDSNVEDQAAFGYQLNQMVATGGEIGGFTNPDDVQDDFDFNLGKISAMRDNANKLYNEAKSYAKRISILQKTTGDSLILGPFGDTTATYESRISLFYDSDTDIYSYELVRKELNTIRRVQYDSSRIRFLGEEEKFLGIYGYQMFAANFILATIENELTATDWDVDGEVTGFTAITTSNYNENRQLQRVVSSITFDPDGSGTLTQTFFFRDGTSSTHTVTFNLDGSGSFSRTFRNGTVINGSFDNVQDDGEGFYQSTITFPSGYYISNIFKSADVLFDFINEQMTASYIERWTFASGRIDSARMNITVSEEGGFRTTVLDVTRHNGAFGTITITETDDLTLVEGEWTTFNGFYIKSTAEYYEDGSAWLHYDVYRNKTAFDNGQSPIASADYNFSPDGSGGGTLSYEGEDYEVDLDDAGRGKITRGNQIKDINLYR